MQDKNKAIVNLNAMTQECIIFSQKTLQYGMEFLIQRQTHDALDTRICHETKKPTMNKNIMVLLFWTFQ